MMQTLEDIIEAANVHDLRPAPFGDSLWARKRGGKINIEVGPKKQNNRRMVVLSDTVAKWGSDDDADQVLGFLGDISLPVTRIKLDPILVSALDDGSEAAVSFDLDVITIRVISHSDDGVSVSEDHRIEFKDHEKPGFTPFDAAISVTSDVRVILANLGESVSWNNDIALAAQFIARVREHNRSMQ